MCGSLNPGAPGLGMVSRISQTPIDAGFEAKQPALLHIYRAGEGGPQPPSPERIV